MYIQSFTIVSYKEMCYATNLHHIRAREPAYGTYILVDKESIKKAKHQVEVERAKQ